MAKIEFVSDLADCQTIKTGWLDVFVKTEDDLNYVLEVATLDYIKYSREHDQLDYFRIGCAQVIVTKINLLPLY